MTKDNKDEIVLMDNSQGSSQYLQKSLETLYSLKNWGVGETNYAKAKGIVILGSGKISKEEAEKIKKFYDEGRFVVIGGNNYQIGGDLKVAGNPDKSFNNWLKDQGVEITDDLVYDASSAIASFRTNNGNLPVQYPYWVIAGGKGINRSMPVTAGISSLIMPWAARLETSGDNWETLVTSSDRSGADNNLGDITPNSKRWQGEAKFGGPIKIGVINAQKRLAVISSEQIASDQFVSNNPGNLSLVLNTTDMLAGDKRLLSIRSKEIGLTPIRPLPEPLKELFKYGAVAATSLISGLVFAANWYARKKRNRW
jgi:ABC-type uncharacterized transport system involved in gliding motility auxiliary subunit